ncbi:MAG TPA: zinc ribbon domain-containing protein, partial [Ktedonobacterales bacterium]|nr:zinc ribbon domain-containing protein [Ktedonobacterales bacterium]
MRCSHCGRELPEGASYCPHCGTQQHLAIGAARTRAFAANPGEHVYHPSVVSTFFPHLGPVRTNQARWLLLLAAAAIFLIGLGRFVP